MSFAEWRKVDLHIHSNGSHDCSLTPKAIVDKVIQEGISLFSITDHNNVDKIDEFRKIVNEKKLQGIEIEFLPGIELRTNRGKDGVAIHLVIIFPESFSKQQIMDRFLSANHIKLTRTHLIDYGRAAIGGDNPDIQYKKGCEIAYVDFKTAVELAHELGALVIAVHPKDGAGIERELDYMQRTSDTFAQLLTDSVRLIDIMELRKEVQKAQQDRIFYLNHLNNFIKVMPAILCSDAHSLEKIGSKFTYIKMDTLDLGGLKQIIFEPENRIVIRLSGPPVPAYPHIVSLKTDGGYYKNIEFNFAPELNCIIGGRGSGKSVVVDLLRFVFNKYSPDDKDYQEYLDRLYNLLKYENSVEVLIKINGGITSVKRKLDIRHVEGRNGAHYVDNSPSLHYGEFDVELYNQGNLKQITRKVHEQLRLIDEIGNHHNINNELKELQKQLDENAIAQLGKVSEMTNSVNLINSKDNIITTIQDKEALLTDDKIRQFNLLQEDKKYYDLAINNLETLMEKRKKYMETLKQLSTISFPDDVGFMAQLKTRYENIFKKLNELEDQSERFLLENTEELKIIEVDGTPWIFDYTENERDYSEYLKSNGLENLADETKQLKALKDKLLNIENNIEPIFKQNLQSLQQMQTRRVVLLERFYTKKKELRAKRVETCARLSSEENGLKVSISPKVDKTVFQKYLDEILNGLNIKNRESVLKDIVSATNSIDEFCSLIINREVKNLEKIYKISTDAAGKIISRFSPEILVPGLSNHMLTERLFDIEQMAFEDIIDIEIRDQNDSKYKKFSRFSPGQQCAYLLSILLDANDSPLIIDQPEDELDWNYIKEIIEKIRRCKNMVCGKGRQFIFVTHNQNITVLADSENILKVINIPMSGEDVPEGKIEAQGALERMAVKNAVLSLEGGPEAFKLRSSKYGFTPNE